MTISEVLFKWEGEILLIQLGKYKNILNNKKEITLDKVWLICTYSTSQKNWTHYCFNVFERSLLCSSSYTFIWSKIQKKQ